MTPFENTITSPLPPESIEAGPKPTRSLLKRGSDLASARQQLAVLNDLNLDHTQHRGHFLSALEESGWPVLRPQNLEIFQINIGKLCNMTCRHCHVDAGPDRVRENMTRQTMEACLRVLDQTTAATVDITGGAPELNPHFRFLVDECVKRGKHVIDRCNLTVLLLDQFKDTPMWFAERGVEVACSLPHYRKLNTDSQRGEGTFIRSIEALRRLNDAGYGKGNPKCRLTLVSNPVGAFIAGNQKDLENEWKRGLRDHYGVQFDRLITINNMPISRYLEWLINSGNLQTYMETLVNAFNPATIEGLMCRNTISVGWDGTVYDCDFNQMLEINMLNLECQPIKIQNFQLADFQHRTIRTDRHCFGCTAGAGSSCGGALK